MAKRSFDYDGYISYSHAADDLLAPRLQAGLQRLAKPWWSASCRQCRITIWRPPKKSWVQSHGHSSPAAIARFDKCVSYRPPDPVTKRLLDTTGWIPSYPVMSSPPMPPAMPCGTPKMGRDQSTRHQT